MARDARAYEDAHTDTEDPTTGKERIRRRCPRPDNLVFHSEDEAAEWAGPAYGRHLWGYRCPCRAGHWHLTSWPPARAATR